MHLFSFGKLFCDLYICAWLLGLLNVSKSSFSFTGISATLSSYILMLLHTVVPGLYTVCDLHSFCCSQILLLVYSSVAVIFPVGSNRHILKVDKCAHSLVHVCVSCYDRVWLGHICPKLMWSDIWEHVTSYIVIRSIFYWFLPQDRNTFHRFDKFNSKYNPIGKACYVHSTNTYIVYIYVMLYILFDRWEGN